MNKSLFQLSFFVSVIILIIVSFYSYTAFKDFQEDARLVTHTIRVKTEIEKTTSIPRDLSMELHRAVLNRDTIDTSVIERLDLAARSHYNTLDSLLSDNKEQVQNLDSLKTLLDRHWRKSETLIAFMSKKYELTTEIRQLLLNEELSVDRIKALSSKMYEIEDSLLDKRKIQRAESAKWAPQTLFALAIIAISLISYLFLNTFNLLKKNQKVSQELNTNVNELNEEIRRRSSLQDLLKGVLDTSNNGIMAFDAIRDKEGEIIDFKATSVNKKAVEMVGVSEEDQLSSTLLTITPGNKEVGLFDLYVNVTESGNMAHEVKYYNHDNLETWFDITAIKKGDGFVVTFADITESKQAERDSEEQKKILESTNQELERFAYVASHDLQEPLRKIRTFGDRLHDLFSDQLEEKAQDYIKRMRNAAERMQILIDDLLKFSRISRQEVPLEKLDLNIPLRQVLEVLDLEIKNSGAVINHDQLPITMGDESQVRQLFQNLISNTIKYAREGISLVVDIKCEKVSNQGYLATDEKECWQITVADNGIGFEDQYKTKIFEIFERLHGRTEYKGTGIGLAICEKIVSRHGGSISASGVPNEGATFNIYLPIMI